MLGRRGRGFGFSGQARRWLGAFIGLPPLPQQPVATPQNTRANSTTVRVNNSNFSALFAIIEQQINGLGA